MDKLSELSKPVAFIESHDKLKLEAGFAEVVQPFPRWGASIPLYSQEYVSALLADNERVAGDLVARNGEIEGLRKRSAELLAELEAKDTPKDIRVAEIEKRLKQRAEEAESRIAELEAKLATPVRLPTEHELHQVSCSECAGNCLELVENTVRAAGFKVKGDA